MDIKKDVKLKKVWKIFLISSLVVILLSNICGAIDITKDIRMKSIVPVSYVPIKNFPYDDFMSFHYGFLKQKGTLPDVFRNQIIILDEYITPESLEYEWLDGPIVNYKDLALRKVHNGLYHKNYTYYDILYPLRWSVFILAPNSLYHIDPPSELFGNNIENVFIYN